MRMKKGKVTVAAVQMCCSRSREENLDRAEELVREAAAKGAQVILLPELFETWYFCQERNYDSYRLALPLEENPGVMRLRRTAAELKAVLPVSFFERESMKLFSPTSTLVSGFMMRPPVPSPLP